MLLKFSQFSHFATPPQQPHFLRHSPPLCSCPWVMCISSCTELYIPMAILRLPICTSFFLKLLFNYSCLHFVPASPSHPSQTHLLPCPHPPPGFCPCVLYSSYRKPLFPPSPPHSPLAIVRVLLTTMSLVIFCLQFLLLIMFQSKVRSYGIFPSPPSLFHLA